MERQVQVRRSRNFVLLLTQIQQHGCIHLGAMRETKGALSMRFSDFSYCLC